MEPGRAAPRIAVVGCGAVGRRHGDALGRAGLAPAALVDPDADRRSALAERWPTAAVGRDVNDVLDDCDAAIVATPARSHAPVTVALLEAGKDVLVEKPMAAGVAEARSMVAAASASGRILQVAQTRRRLAVLDWAHGVLATGVLGSVFAVDVEQGGRDDWVAASVGYMAEAAGGVVADNGCHVLDLVGWWFGPLTVVACTDDACGGQEAEAELRMVAGPVPVRVQLSRLRTLRNTIRVEAEAGVLEVAVDHHQRVPVVRVPDGLGISPFVPGEDDDLDRQMDRQLALLLAALRGEPTPGAATASEGLEVVRLIADAGACRTSEPPWWTTSAVTGR